MSDTPDDLHYANSHEWARLDGGSVVVGIRDHAQDALGDGVYVALPGVGQEVQARQEIAVVETVKAASDIYAPVGGLIEVINQALEDDPEIVNQDPYGNGWFFRIAPQDANQLDDLLNAEAYAELCAQDQD